MTINKLLQELEKESCELLFSSEIETEIFTVQIYRDDTNLQTNILYIVTEEMIFQKKSKGNYSFIFISDKNIPTTYPKNWNIFVYKKKKTAQELEKLILDVFAKTNRLTNNMFRLIQVLHTNLGLQSLIDEACTLLDNPIFLVDNSYKILASSNMGFRRADLEAQKMTGYVAEKNVENIKKVRLHEKARENRYPYYAKNPDSGEGWITALIYIHGIESAHIGISDNNRPFTTQDYELIDFLCSLISLELQKTDFYRTNDSLKHSFFLSDLLDSQIKDPTLIEKRLQSLNWKTTEFMFIMTIREKQTDIFDRKAQLISKQLHQHLPHSRWVIFEGRIVFLVCLPDASKDIFKAGSHLEHYLSINNLGASVSRCFNGFLNLRKYYEESLIAYDFGLQLNPGGHIYLYEDFICHHIGKIISEKHNLPDFYHEGVLQLKEYDKQHNTNLMETLSVYLTFPDSPTKASEKLFIHKNTLFYRMGKIKELFSMDLSNGEERLKIHLTIKFMESE